LWLSKKGDRGSKKETSMKPGEFDYYAPSTVGEALDLLAQLGYDGKVLAGGQSLIPAMNFRMARPPALVDINNISELDYIRPTKDGGVTIGAIARQSDVEFSEVTRDRAPLIHEVMPYIAHPQIRNRGTFCGGFAHADPAGQIPGIVLAQTARCLVRERDGERWVDASDFFVGPFMTVLEPEELLVEISIPPIPPRTGTCYKQVARQKGTQFQVAVAVMVTLDKRNRCTEANVVLMGVGMTAILAKEVANALIGKELVNGVIDHAAEIAAEKEADPGEDIHATEEYRRHLVRVLVRQALTIAAKRAMKEGG
jgi:CO/xanthine dehydrogenase FAD-binding subunit